MLAVNNLTKLYKNGRGAEQISFTVERGEVLGLLGPNGSGKTTTMKAICGLVNHNAGAVTIDGIDAFLHHEKAMSHTGSLIEAPALYNHMTAMQNLLMAARFHHMGRTEAANVLQLCGMERYAKDKVGTFSLGMRQRIGLALALLSNPSLLILDEPANGLDIEGMVQIREIVKSAAEKGSAVLISSHLAHEIELCATKVVIMHSGRMLAAASISEVLSSHASVEEYFLAEVTKSRLEVTA